MGRILTYDEMVKKLKNAYNKGVIITCSGEFGTIFLANTDHLQVNNVGDKISMNDDYDTYISIYKSFIGRITLSDFDASSEQINLDLGNTKMTFVICN